MLDLLKVTIEKYDGAGAIKQLGNIVLPSRYSSDTTGGSGGVCSSSPLTDDTLKSTQLNQHYFCKATVQFVVATMIINFVARMVIL